MREGGILRIRSNAARSVRFSSPMLAESPKEAEKSSLYIKPLAQSSVGGGGGALGLPRKLYSTIMERVREVLSRLSANMPGGGTGGPLAKALGLGAVGVGGLAYGGSSCIFNVEGGHRAVMFNRIGGVQERVRAEGTHILVPWFQRPIIYDVRTKPRMIQSMTGSKGAYTSTPVLCSTESTLPLTFAPSEESLWLWYCVVRLDMLFCILLSQIFRW